MTTATMTSPTRTIDVRYLYESGRLYKPSFRYGVRYYERQSEMDSEISRLKEPVVVNALRWVTKKSREALIFLRRDGRVVERFVFHEGKPKRLFLL